MNPNALLDKLGAIVSGLGFWPKITKFIPVGAVLAKYDGGKLFREVVATLMKLACIGVALGGLRVVLLFEVRHCTLVGSWSWQRLVWSASRSFGCATPPSLRGAARTATASAA